MLAIVAIQLVGGYNLNTDPVYCRTVDCWTFQHHDGTTGRELAPNNNRRRQLAACATFDSPEKPSPTTGGPAKQSTG